MRAEIQHLITHMVMTQHRQSLNREIGFFGALTEESDIFPLCQFW